MNKTKKTIYLTQEAIKKLELLSNLNGLDNSKILDILLKKQKKLQLY